VVSEGAENDLLVRQCTFVHAASYCHTRDATQRCQKNFQHKICVLIFSEAVV